MKKDSDSKEQKKSVFTVVRDASMQTSPTIVQNNPSLSKIIASAPTVLMAAYPVRGLDINSSYTIYNLLNKQKENGVAVIFVGEDLEVLIELCDRIIVMNSGKITGEVEGRLAKREEIGIMMTKDTSVSEDKTEKNKETEGESNE